MIAVIFGTFATRSGLVESVHSFARSGIGIPMFLFWFAVTFISTAMALYRYNQGLLKDEHEFKSLFSRETLFVVNNVVFIAIFFAVFWWSFGAPITSELFFDKVVTYGEEHFNQHLWPLLLALYVLMLAVPLSGYVMSSSFEGSHGIDFFAWTLPRLAPINERVFEISHALHGWLPWLLLAVVVLHVAGAFKHRWLDGPGADVLPRMLRG